MQMMKRALKYKITAFLLALLLCISPLAPAAAGAGGDSPEVTVQLELPGQVRVEETFVAELRISPVENFWGANYELFFDPALLEIKDVYGGEIGGKVLSQGNWTLDEGRIRVVQHFADIDGADGSGALLRLLFAAKNKPASGTLISFNTGFCLLSDAEGSPIPAVWRPGETAIIPWGQALQIKTLALPSSPEGQPYQAVLEAGGGVPPYRWEVVEAVGESLPAGLSLAAQEGKISGTPSQSGSFNFTLLVEDSIGNMATAFFTLKIGQRAGASLSFPAEMRPQRNYLGGVTYKNESEHPLPASLYRVSSPDGAPLRLKSADPFSLNPLYLLGISSRDPADSLLQGEHHTVFLETEGIFVRDFYYELEELFGQEKALDWAAFRSKKPAGKSTQGWDALISLLQSRCGTMEGFLEMLQRNARYLGSKGIFEADAARLFALEMRDLSAPHYYAKLEEALDFFQETPGPSLSFSRTYPQALEERYMQGPLGMGWRHNFDIVLYFNPGGDVILSGPELSDTFQRQNDGGYRSASGSSNQLQKNGSKYELRSWEGLLYSFNSNGRLESIADRNGNTLSIFYESSRHPYLTRVLHSNGFSLQFEYQQEGNLLSAIRDQHGRVTRYSYTSTWENLALPDGSTTTEKVYWLREALSEVSCHDGLRTTYSYSSGFPGYYGLTAIVYPDGTRKGYAYDARGRLSSEHRGNPAQKYTYAYPDAGTLLVTDPVGAQTTYYFDPQGRILEIKDQQGERQFMHYNDLGRVASTAGAEGRATIFQYDGRGNTTYIKDAENNEFRFGYAYGGSGLEWMEDARGNRYSLSYDQNGNLSRILYPDETEETFTYDSAGQILSAQNRRGDLLEHRYDSAGRLLQETYADGREVFYTYSDKGLLLSVTDAAGSIAFQYNDREMITRVTYPSGHFFCYSYDSAGRRISRTDQDGAVLRYSYDGEGNLFELRDGKGALVIRYQYDVQGRIVREARGNGLVTEQSYDDLGRLASLENKDAEGAVLSSFHYTYDAWDWITSISTPQGVTSYQYDKIGRLTSVTYPDGSSEKYLYDAAGNRIREEQQTAGGAVKQKAYQVNNLNQYTAAKEALLSYDRNGNLTSRLAEGKTSQYHYDQMNRLVAVDSPRGSWQYRYDALGNLAAVIENGEERILITDPLDPAGIAAEYSAEGTLIARYLQGMGFAARVDHRGSIAYYTFDGTGHTRELVSADARILNRYDYTPFGSLLVKEEEVSNPFQYSGRWGSMAEGHGLYRMGQRFYDPALGRFVSPEPAALSSGEDNLYRYCGNNPVSFIDPDGDIFFLPLLAIGAKAALAWGAKTAVALGAKAIAAKATALVIGKAAAGWAIRRYVVTKAATWAAVKAGFLVARAAGVAAKGWAYGKAVMTSAYLCTHPTAAAGLAFAGNVALNYYDPNPVAPNASTLVASMIDPACDYVGGLLAGQDRMELARRYAAGIWSWDPNEKEGPPGDLFPGEWISYKILFENDAEDYPKIEELTAASVILRLQINEEGRAYYVLLPAKEPAPNAARIKEGKDGDGEPALQSGSVELFAFTDATARLEGLEAETSYYLYVVAEDLAGNFSAVELREFTTPEEAEEELETQAFLQGFSLQQMPAEEIDRDHLGIKYLRLTAVQESVSGEEALQESVSGEEALLPEEILSSFGLPELDGQEEDPSSFSLLDLDGQEEDQEEGQEEDPSSFDLPELDGQEADTSSFGLLGLDGQEEDTDPPLFARGATAPVQELLITDSLHPALDWSSFRPTGYGFGEHLYTIESEQQHYAAQKIINDYRPDKDLQWLVDFAVSFDLQKGEASWRFRLLDPDTELIPDDVFAGFLPLNDKEKGDGEGYVTFSVKVREDAAPGTIISNQAAIYFDVNPAIFTEEISNTVVEKEETVPAVPKLSLSSREVDFGSALVGEEVCKSVTVYNSGTARLNLDLAADGAMLPAEPFAAMADDIFPASLEPGERLTIPFSFTPEDEGNQVSWLKFGSNDQGEPLAVITLKGKGLPRPAPSLSCYPPAVVFSSVTAGTAASQAVTVYNNGAADLVMGTISPVEAPFSIPVESNFLSEAVIKPGESARLTLQFAPGSAGNYSTTLVVAHNDPGRDALVLPISGTALAPAPELRLNRQQLLFGAVDLGSSVQRNLTLTNCGDGELVIEEISIENTAINTGGEGEHGGDENGEASFVLSDAPSAGTTLASGESLTMAVTFSPSAEAEYSSHLKICSNDPQAPIFTIYMDGQGQGAVPMSALIVSAEGGATVLKQDARLQMNALVLPQNASDQRVSWSVQSITGEAVIDEEGILSAQEPGTVTVLAHALDGSGVCGTLDLVIMGMGEEQVDECFIATAAFGSKLAPTVKLLRRFRDEKLLTTGWGQAFVRYYYSVSPPVADYIAGRAVLKFLVRILLLPVIATAYLLMHRGLLLILIICLLMACLYGYERRRKGRIPAK